VDLIQKLEHEDIFFIQGRMFYIRPAEVDDLDKAKKEVVIWD
jgi:hypothetical protein